MRTFDYFFYVPVTNITTYTNIPIIITSVLGHNNLSPNKVMFHNSDSLQFNKENTLKVEIYTGITQEKTENYQYNLYIDDKVENVK